MRSGEMVTDIWQHGPRWDFLWRQHEESWEPGRALKKSSLSLLSVRRWCCRRHGSRASPGCCLASGCTRWDGPRAEGAAGSPGWPGTGKYLRGSLRRIHWAELLCLPGNSGTPIFCFVWVFFLPLLPFPRYERGFEKQISLTMPQHWHQVFSLYVDSSERQKDFFKWNMLHSFQARWQNILKKSHLYLKIRRWKTWEKGFSAVLPKCRLPSALLLVWCHRNSLNFKSIWTLVQIPALSPAAAVALNKWLNLFKLQFSHLWGEDNCVISQNWIEWDGTDEGQAEALSHSRCLMISGGSFLLHPQPRSLASSFSSVQV